MRPVLFISLLLLSTLFHEDQGRHLRNHKINENESIRRSEGSNGEKKSEGYKDEHCSSSGRNRKLIAKTTSSTYTTTTASKNLKNEGTKANPTLKDKSTSSESPAGRKEEKFSVNAPPETGHRETSNEHYPNVFDLAGMDYSPARRKAPIHN